MATPLAAAVLPHQRRPARGHHKRRLDRAAVAAGREIARGDWVPGMAESQADLVHQGIVYDLQVDSTHTEALECARIIAARVS